MRNQDTDDIAGEFDYSPNQLARLSADNPELYRRVVQSNLDEDDSVEDWEGRNMDNARRYSGDRVYPLEGLDGQ